MSSAQHSNSNNQIQNYSAQCLPYTGTNPPQGTPGQVKVYDAAGNLECTGQQNTNAQAFLWDGESRLAQLWGQQNNNSYSQVASYSYDSSSTRIRSDFFTGAAPAPFREYTSFGGMTLAEKDQNGGVDELHLRQRQ